MSSSSVPQVVRVADLARLHLDEKQVKRYQDHFERTLEHFESLQAVDVKGVEPMVTPHDVPMMLREDQALGSDGSEDLLSQAPALKDRQFKVPPVV